MTTTTKRSRVVLVTPSSPLREQCRKALEAGHHTVEIAPSLQSLQSHNAPLVVFDWSLLGQLPVTAFRQMKVAHPQLLFVALIEKVAQLPIAADAGVHDFVRLPLVADELSARVQRLLQSAKSEEPSLRELERLPQALASDLSGFASTHLDGECDVPLPCDFGDLVVARLPMHLAAQSLEIGVYVVSTRGVLARLADLLGLPDADTAVLEDLARELTNQSAGALKRTCSPAGAQLTMGLPTTVSSSALPASAWVARVTGSDLEFTVVVEMRRRPPTAVAIGDLREGMVVVGDVRNAAGTLLLGSGTRLTLTMVSRVRSLLPTGQRVEILDPEFAEAILSAAQ